MMCNACGKNSAAWTDWAKDVGHFGFCIPCVRKYMPGEFDVMNICNQCNKMFKFKFTTQKICGSCFYKNKGVSNGRRS